MKLKNKFKKDKVLYFLGVLIIGIFIILLVRFTYAYFAANIKSASQDVILSSDTTDDLSFEVGDPLAVNATPTTLPENGTNLTSETYAKAILYANSTNQSATYDYYVYLTISNNTFIYSDGSTPEIILTITDPYDEPVTELGGLTYGTFNGVSGFDITTASGIFTVAAAHVITSSSSTEATVQEWTFTLTYLNLSYDQSANYDNSMTIEVRMNKELTLADYIISLYTSDEDGSNIYYHDGIGNYENAAYETGDYSYRYAGASEDVDNYVCFGYDLADEETCPDDYLYRIIGLFDDDGDGEYQVKLIKLTRYGGSTYTWTGLTEVDINGYRWNQSLLNREILNGTYLTEDLGDYWSNLIDSHAWKAGSIEVTDGDNVFSNGAQTAYNYEVGSNASSTTYSTKIGLMYVSDYYYAALPTYWTYRGYTLSSSPLPDYSDATDDNWMYSGIEWTISYSVGSNDLVWAYYVRSSGQVYYYAVYSPSNTASVRPVFYLNSDVKYVSGDGTKENPFIIE